ncbi:MAG: extracellular solute-binding protein [Bacilli bacterium]|nr:extracellular solute-binding protein [Bacilli bacterium]MBN2696537.1 extracellular solute-binding protein [Bacilli bacterium]
MKKIVVLLVMFFLTFVVVGCVGVVTTTTTTQATTTTTASTQSTTTQSQGTTVSGQTTLPTTTQPTTTTAKVVMDLPDDEVEILFWHIYGQEKSALLDELIADFEAMYPNVTIVSTSQSDYDTLREKINLGISVGQVPTMALGYPDHFAAYITTGAVQPLDTYINSNVRYELTDPTSTIFDQGYVDVALDIEDYLPGYLAENNQYIGGFYYSLPYSKSTETMAVNRTVLKAHVDDIRALGITISDEGFFSHETPLTFEDIQKLSTILVNETDSTDVANYQCAYLINYDSPGNMFINMSRQWNAGYTNIQGEILINNQITKNMLNYTKAMFDARTLVLPVEWSEGYGSAYFMTGDVCMTIGSTAGVNYNIPTGTDDNEQFGKFEVDFLTVPQTVTQETNNTAVTISDGTNDYNITGSLSAVQQGPNIGVFSNASANEKLFAWLFIKWLTTSENTARWAMDTGYLPVRLSSYSSTTPIELTPTFSITYDDFMGIAQTYWNEEGLITKRDISASDSFRVSSQWIELAADSLTGLGSFNIEEGEMTEPIISKYIETTGTTKVLEIYNGTGAELDLSAYTLGLYADGSTTPTATLTLSGTVADGDVFVIYNSTDAAVIAEGDLENATVMAFDGNDVLVLKKGAAIVDSIGQISKTADFAKDVTLVRFGNLVWEPTNEYWDYLYKSMVANIAKNQADYYRYDPAFAAGSGSAGSAQVRVEAGYCLENIYTAQYTPEGALSFMLNQLVWG